MGIEEYCKLDKLEFNEEFKEYITDEVKHAAYEIINRKGYTNYAVALAVRRITEAILGDEQSILTVSGLLDGENNLHDVYMAMPCIVGRNGIRKIIPIPLSNDESEKLNHSANILKDIIQKSDINI